MVVTSFVLTSRLLSGQAPDVTEEPQGGGFAKSQDYTKVYRYLFTAFFWKESGRKKLREIEYVINQY
jgi:hypothetical protein